ncbi:MAG: hypothetical protein P1P89_20510 [Desulfobacterales bacterium]|nr:hypothetical protein [Desulfobacterales bacterium]
MGKKENNSQEENRFDLARLIRSVQRIEGNPDCFGKASRHCSQRDCCWKPYCLPPPGFGQKSDFSNDK